MIEIYCLLIQYPVSSYQLRLQNLETLNISFNVVLTMCSKYSSLQPYRHMLHPMDVEIATQAKILNPRVLHKPNIALLSLV